MQSFKVPFILTTVSRKIVVDKIIPEPRSQDSLDHFAANSVNVNFVNEQTKNNDGTLDGTEWLTCELP